jgi:Domain of unknown function (DUF4389)
MKDRAIRLVIRDPDLERSRLTVAFRLILAIPHFIWLVGWFSLATLVAIASWIATLITKTPPPMFHRFLSSYVRYAAHLVSYTSFAADPYPGFTGRPGSYPIDLEIDEPGEQNRWVTGFRFFLALPGIVLADTMLGFGTSFSGGWGTQIGGIVATGAFLGWFACIFRGRMPQGLRDMIAYAVGYSAQVNGYLFLLTDRYPNSDPAFYESANVVRDDPISILVEDDLRRSRLTVGFRILLAVPHLVWLVLWGVAVVFAAIANWFVALFRGRPSEGLHAFLEAYLRYQTHVMAYVQLVANPFPGFVGAPGSYPVDLELPEATEPQSRLVTGFRLFLAFPALLVASALLGVAYVAAFFGWFYALVRGEMPRGLRNLGAYALRYSAQTNGYLYLLTERYPYAGPSAGRQLTLSPMSAGPVTPQEI